MSDPWFVRRRTATSYTINPICWQGWAVTAAFVAASLIITPLATARMWIIWGTLFAVQIFTFALIAWRKSVPIEEYRK